MPAQEHNYRRQRAILWVATGHDEYGQATVADPVDLWVRWNTKRIETVDRDGSVVALDAMVIVDRRIPLDSAMWLGELDDWYGTGSAGDDSEVMQVKTFAEVLDVKGRVAHYSVGLGRYKDNPPALT